jgi:hypothetical protein
MLEKIVDGNTLTINTSDWIEGLYLVNIGTKNGTVVRRISIVH